MHYAIRIDNLNIMELQGKHQNHTKLFTIPTVTSSLSTTIQIKNYPLGISGI